MKLAAVFLFAIALISSCGGGGGSSTTPAPTVVYMWSSTTASNGNIGGVSGADTICQTDAATGSFATTVSTHRAALFTATNSPMNYISNNPPLKRPDGTAIANRYSDFWNNAVTNILAGVRGLGGAINSYWTGGRNTSGFHCRNWMTDSPSTAFFASVGAGDNTTVNRYDDGIYPTCNNSRRILCISY